MGGPWSERTVFRGILVAPSTKGTDAIRTFPGRLSSYLEKTKSRNFTPPVRNLGMRAPYWIRSTKLTYLVKQHRKMAKSTTFSLSFGKRTRF